nr:hypothetical protein [uncultured Duganella sp.]
MNPVILGYRWCTGAAIASALVTYLIKMSSLQGEGWSSVRLAWLGSACFSYVLGFVCYSVAAKNADQPGLSRDDRHRADRRRRLRAGALILS